MVEPEIPQNTGNIARTCAATHTKLHLVHPLGFDIDEKAVKRAGLDYWPYVELENHQSLEDFLNKYKESRMFFATTKGGTNYCNIEYKPDDFLIFGKETEGLPKWLLEQYKDQTIKIPMAEETALRSLNLSNSANIVLFEALRQQGFPHLK